MARSASATSSRETAVVRPSVTSGAVTSAARALNSCIGTPFLFGDAAVGPAYHSQDAPITTDLPILRRFCNKYGSKTSKVVADDDRVQAQCSASLTKF